MEKKQNHQWLCLYRDSIYKCTSDTYKLGFDQVSTDGWGNTKDVCKVGLNEAIIVYSDRLYSLNLTNAKHKAYGSNNWSNCVGAISHKGNAVLIGRDWGTGVCSAKNAWKWKQMHNTTWRDAKMMVKIGEKGYALGTNYIYEIDLNTCQYKQLSKENWGNVRCAVVYNGYIYGFFSSGIWKIGTDGKRSEKVSSDNWGKAVWKCAVNFGPHCYVHLPNAIWYVDLRDGAFRSINKDKWDGSRALIPLLSNEQGFNPIIGRGKRHKRVIVGRNRTSNDQEKEYSITVGNSMTFKSETTIEASTIFYKASLTLGFEKTSEKSETIKDKITVKPGRAVAVYQELKEYEVWQGIKENIIGVLGDNSKETTFYEGNVDDDFPEYKYF